MIIDKTLSMIGNTPILKLNTHFLSNHKELANIFVKLENKNPGGSIKDRVAYSMILEAEKAGILKENSIIIEPTSGNTGIALAYIGKLKGYKVIIVMPETMSIERRNILKAYGAEVVLTQGSLGMTGAISKAEELALQYPNSFIPQQFTNSANPLIHYQTTAIEISQEFNKLDAFVVGVGTGGTLSGVGKHLKNTFPNIQIVAVEPYDSAVISGEEPAPHVIQGIGAGFIPSNLNTALIDQILKVRNRECIEMCRQIAQHTGLFLGYSSGANIFAAIQMAQKLGPDKNIITIAPDGGEKYLSTNLYNFE